MQAVRKDVPGTSAGPLLPLEAATQLRRGQVFSWCWWVHLEQRCRIWHKTIESGTTSRRTILKDGQHPIRHQISDLTRRISTWKAPETVIQPESIRLQAYILVNQHPQPNSLPTQSPNRMSIKMLQVRPTQLQEIRPRLSSQIFHSGTNDRCRRKTDP